MELYLDSANLKEIEEAFKLGFLNGLTTTPTFMQKEGITDIDGTIVKLSKIVPVLQIEALGNTAEEVLAEAERQLALGLDKTKTVFKIPVSLEGVRACKLLRDKDLFSKRTFSLYFTASLHGYAGWCNLCLSACWPFAGSGA